MPPWSRQETLNKECIFIYPFPTPRMKKKIFKIWEKYEKLDIKRPIDRLPKILFIFPKKNFPHPHLANKTLKKI